MISFKWFYGVVVSTSDFESGDAGSNPARTLFSIFSPSTPLLAKHQNAPAPVECAIAEMHKTHALLVYTHYTLIIQSLYTHVIVSSWIDDAENHHPSMIAALCSVHHFRTHRHHVDVVWNHIGDAHPCCPSSPGDDACDMHPKIERRICCDSLRD
jgi:hypothetical protein